LNAQKQVAETNSQNKQQKRIVLLGC